MTLAELPGEATHRKEAMMTKAVGHWRPLDAAVPRIWRAHQLQPPRLRQFKVSHDLDFVPNPRDNPVALMHRGEGPLFTLSRPS